MAKSKEFLRISNLQAWYGESHILHGVDLTVNEGEVVTLLGRNGAGRTTTVKSILGLVGRRTGSITIKGQETVNWAPHQIAKLGLGYCPEERGIFFGPDLRRKPFAAPRDCPQRHVGGRNLRDVPQPARAPQQPGHPPVGR